MKKLLILAAFLLLPLSLHAKDSSSFNCVTITPEKMNILYMGIDNPLNISVSGIPEDALEIRSTSGVVRKIQDSYIARPGKHGRCRIDVFKINNQNRELIGSKNFRVKSIPYPVAHVRGVKGKKVSRMDIVRSKGIAVVMPGGFEFDVKFSVISFKIATIRGGMVNELSNRGPNFSQQQKNLIKGVRKGGKLFIEHIKVKGPDGETRMINDIILTVN